VFRRQRGERFFQVVSAENKFVSQKKIRSVTNVFSVREEGKFSGEHLGGKLFNLSA